MNGKPPTRRQRSELLLERIVTGCISGLAVASVLAVVILAMVGVGS